MESFIIMLILYRLASLCNAADSCDALRRTVVSVNKCPENEIEWMEAAKRKNCTSLAESCSEQERIVYHCVLNPYVNETLEVCAIGRNILLGKCTEYSILGNLIQESGVDCTTFPNPCPVIYHSTEAYKYQDCYKLVPRPTTSQPTTKLQVHSTTVSNKLTKSTMMPENFTISVIIPERSDYKDTVVWTTVTILILISVLILVLMICMWKRRHKLRKKDKSKSFEDDLEGRISVEMVDHVNITDENEPSLYPSGRHLINQYKEIQAHKAGETQALLHETQPKNFKDLLECLDENVMKLMEAKTTEEHSVASSDLDDDWDLPKNVEDIYNTVDISDEHIPLIQSCIQEVVMVKNYFDKRKHKPIQIKPI